ncbi:MAG: hypothetical protein ACRDLL_00730 [Solirubrobacterales bacterium]
MHANATSKSEWPWSSEPWPEEAIERLEELTGVPLRRMGLAEFVQRHPDVPDFLFDRFDKEREWDADRGCDHCGQEDEPLTNDGYCRLCVVMEFGYWNANRTYSYEILEFALERARDDSVDVTELVAKATS